MLFRSEDPLAAARRELAEETDLVADRWTPLVSFLSSPGGSDERIRLYEARGLRPASEAHGRTAEEAEIVVRRVPFREVLDAVLGGRIANGPLMIAVLAVHARGR